ncbi:MAG TPA: hypothetical protein VM166_14540 [Gemmatimonadaceae bacterium]|nr:hypothetical protein [Gemmatimonadaceae bacterium]
MLLTLGTILTAPSLKAQTSADGPEAVARTFFQAQADARWLDAARLLDLKSFDAYRKAAAVRNRAAKRRAGPSVEQVLAEQPDMPRAVAEYVAKIYTAASDSDALSIEFAHTTSVDTLLALPLVVAAARWLEARDLRWQLERSRAPLPAGCMRPGIGALRTPQPKQVIGGVTPMTRSAASDSASYVLFRDPTATAGRTGTARLPDVLALVKVDDEWRITGFDNPEFAGSGYTYASLGCVR